MNWTLTACAAAAMVASLAGPAFAQGDGDVQAQQKAMRQVDRANRAAARGHPQGDRRNYQQQGQRYDRGAGPDHRFHKGDRLPVEYRNRTYVVDDWRGHHLHAPPRGYHWVQTGGDYVLAAIATGVILELLLNN